MPKSSGVTFRFRRISSRIGRPRRSRDTELGLPCRSASVRAGRRGGPGRQRPPSRPGHVAGRGVSGPATGVDDPPHVRAHAGPVAHRPHLRVAGPARRDYEHFVPLFDKSGDLGLHGDLEDYLVNGTHVAIIDRAGIASAWRGLGGVGRLLIGRMLRWVTSQASLVATHPRARLSTPIRTRPQPCC